SKADSLDRAFDCLLQTRAGAEPGHLARRDLDPLAGLWVHALTGTTVGDRELAEAGEVDVSTPLQDLFDGLEHCVDGLVGLTLPQTRAVSHLVHELGLRHDLLLAGGIRIGRNVTTHADDRSAFSASRAEKGAHY